MEESARDFRVGYDTLFKPPFSYQASTDLNRKRWPREIMGCHAVYVTRSTTPWSMPEPKNPEAQALVPPMRISTTIHYEIWFFFFVILRFAYPCIMSLTVIISY